MLVLSRKLGESIRIGADVVVTVTRVGRQVQLGIDAPRSVRVVRDEVADTPRPKPPLRKRLEGGAR